VGVAGGVAGAELLIWTPPSAFEAAAPFLVLTATLLFLSQERVSRWLKARAAAGEGRVASPAGANVPLDREVTPLGGVSKTSGVHGSEGAIPSGSDASLPDGIAPSVRKDTPVASATQSPRGEAATQSSGTLAPAAQAKNHDLGLRLTPGVAAFLFGVAVYGGYFGAGIGILTLAALGLLGLTNMHQMNAIKNIFTFGVNGVAAVLFMLQGLVNWPLAGLMLIGSLVGGYAGAGTAKKIGQKNVRRLVISIGFLSAAWLLLQLAIGGR
jgi:uncharacterized membrane protein YfcA